MITLTMVRKAEFLQELLISKSKKSFNFTEGLASVSSYRTEVNNVSAGSVWVQEAS